jgi:hypothetical protein
MADPGRQETKWLVSGENLSAMLRHGAGANTERPLRLTSPIASGWSKNHRVGLSPFEKLHLIAAHTHTSHSGRWLLLSSERFQYIPLPDNHYQRNV